MAIGNYWECVLPEGAGTPPLQRIVGDSTMMVQQHFPSWRMRPEGEDLGGADFACMGFTTGDMRAIRRCPPASATAKPASRSRGTAI
jgi:hypothetical protein